MDTYTTFLTLVLFGLGAGLWLFVTRSSERPRDADDDDFVQVFRCDMGQGFSDSDIISLIGFLGSRGVRATYDVAYAGEGIVIKTYVVKVSRHDAARSAALIQSWLAEDDEDPGEDPSDARAARE